MATIRISVTVEASWADSDKLRLMVGSENVADLASSTPAGGKRVVDLPIGSAAAGDVLVLEHAYTPTDICATLPVGVVSVDQAGNASAVTELVVQIADVPEAVGRPDVSSGKAGSVTLTWPASADL